MTGKEKLPLDSLGKSCCHWLEQYSITTSKVETITIFQIFIPSEFFCVTFLAFCTISFKGYSFYLLQFILLNHLFIFLVFLSRAHFITHFFLTLTLLHFAEPLTGWLVEHRETFISEILNSFFF